MTDDDVYRERARLVALVAALYPSVRAYADPHEPEWSVVYVDSPAGQLSWHIAERDVDLFEHVEFVPPNHSRAQWDGHDTKEKYARLAELITKWLSARTVNVHLHTEASDDALRELIQREIHRFGSGPR
jgi:hypothetical protein